MNSCGDGSAVNLEVGDTTGGSALAVSAIVVLGGAIGEEMISHRAFEICRVAFFKRVMGLAMFAHIASGRRGRAPVGKPVRLTGGLKTENADSAVLWMRVDGNRRMIGFDNMLNRAVTGTTDWKQFEVVLDVPPEAVTVVFDTKTNYSTSRLGHYPTLKPARQWMKRQTGEIYKQFRRRQISTGINKRARVLLKVINRSGLVTFK